MPRRRLRGHARAVDVSVSFRRVAIEVIRAENNFEGATAADQMWRAQVLAATKSVDALSALHLRSAAVFRASAVWTILSASLPSSRRMGGSSILTTLRITWAALAGSPGCLPLYSRWNRAAWPTVASYSGRILWIVW